jgi:hypothetical protein
MSSIDRSIDRSIDGLEQVHMLSVDRSERVHMSAIDGWIDRSRFICRRPIDVIVDGSGGRGGRGVVSTLISKVMVLFDPRGTELGVGGWLWNSGTQECTRDGARSPNLISSPMRVAISLQDTGHGRLQW